MSVREDVPLGYTVMVLSAHDPDGPSDGEVTYVYEGNGTVSHYQSISALHCDYSAEFLYP